MAIEWREWQIETFENWEKSIQRNENVFSFEACTGAGKTLVAVEIARRCLDSLGHDFVVMVVPLTDIQGDEFNGAIKDFDRFGIRTSDRLFVQGKRIVSQPTPQRMAYVVTYQSICNNDVVELFDTWKQRGCKFALFFDEVHHTSERGGAWGEFAEICQEKADLTVTMSGTYFRTDGHKIRFLDYDDNGRPKLSCPGYQYSTAVADGVCRPVTFRYQDPDVKCYDERNGESTKLLSGMQPGQELQRAKKEVLRHDGEVVRQLTLDVHQYMMDLRQKFGNAGCLFSCQPSGGRDEERYVHRITSLVKHLTGEEVIEVVSSDRSAAGKLERFKNGSAPYLVAINKISEGVDIPRLRATVMLRYIESEMIFRQLVGRNVRMTDEEDGTAACIFLPKFDSMYRLALNMHNESLTGIRDFECKRCGMYPCICPCVVCGQNPCVCERPPPPPPPETRFEVLDAIPQAGGGSVGEDDVFEKSISIAETLKKTFIQHRHLNPVQLGHALQAGFELSGEGSSSTVSQAGPCAELGKIKRKISRLMGTVTTRFFGGNYGKAWNVLFRNRYGTDWRQAQITWTNERMREFEGFLETIIKEGRI